MPKPLTVWITTNWRKYSNRWEYQTTIPASWEIHTQVKNWQNWTWNNRVVPNQETSTSRGILSPWLFNSYAEYIMGNARLDEAQAWNKIAGRNMSNLRYADDITLIAEIEEELKILLMKVKEWKIWLKTQHSENWDHGVWSSWQIDGDSIETVRDFIFLDSKTTADGDCRHGTKRCLILGRKAMTSIDSILKSKTLLCQQRFV